MSPIQTLFKVLFFIIICGCDNTNVSQRIDSKKALNYFDLNGFIESEIHRLAQKTSFSKTIYVNEEREIKEAIEINLKNELKPFFDSDINKPAWAGKYAIDSTFDQTNELIGLHYKSKDEKLKTKDFIVDFEGKEVSRIFIENATSSSIANTSQVLTYQPKIGFSVESKQEVSLMDKNQFKIEVVFQ